MCGKNQVLSRFFCCLLLCVASRWAFAPPLCSLPLDSAGSESDSLSGLSRLLAISNELALLNETLRSELEGSRRNSKELQSMLEASRRELDGLRSELESLRGASTALLNGAENSNTELSALRQALMTAEHSLASLEQSFEAYRLAAQRRIQGLERSRGVWRIACFVACGLAMGAGITAVIVGR